MPDNKESGEGGDFFNYVSFWIIVALIFCGFFGGNYWCTKSSVVGRIKAYNPAVKEVLYINRNIFERSEVACMTEDKKIVTYWVDCDILFNCKVFAKSEEQEKAAKKAK